MTSGVDIKRAMAMMVKFGLDPMSDSDAKLYAYHLYNLPARAVGDPYLLAAKAAATARLQAAKVQQADKLREMGLNPRDYLVELGKAVFSTAQEVPDEMLEMSVFDADEKELWELATGKRPQDLGDDVTGEGLRMMEEAGVDVYDEELNDDAGSSPERYLGNVEQAINRKQAGSDNLPNMDDLWSKARDKL